MAIILLSCSQQNYDFSASRAYQHIENQVAFGSREAGSIGHSKVYTYIVETCKKLGATVKIQPFTWYDERFNKTYQLKNIVVAFQPEMKSRLFFSTHFDTNPLSEKDSSAVGRELPVLGANDGASGVAVLLELAYQFHQKKPPYGIDMVFFDGEDLGDNLNSLNYCQGSKAFAEVMKTYRPLAGFNVDIVGNPNLEIQKELNSLQAQPDLVEKVWEIAEKLGLGHIFLNENGASIYDDHVPLLLVGIPVINLIDQKVVTENKGGIHHTQQDVLANIDSLSLKAVGDLLMNLTYGEHF